MGNSAVAINPDKCKKDGLCINVCPCEIFGKGESGIPLIREEVVSTCIKCGHCAAICPGGAITLSDLSPVDFQSVPVNTPTLPVLSNLIKNRRSIRNYEARPVEMEKIKELLELTRFCPTAKNTQNLSWIVINGAEKVRALSAAVIDAFRPNDRMADLVKAFDRGEDPIHRGAPQVAIAYGPEKYPWGTMDATIAMANLELAAKAGGLGTCWGGFSTWAASTNPEIGKSIGLSATDKIFAVIMIGYPKYTFRLVPPRKPLRLRII